MGVCDFKTEIAGIHFLFRKEKTICGKQLRLLVVSLLLFAALHYGVPLRLEVMTMISGASEMKEQRKLF